MANSTECGLASIIWTENLTRAHKLSSENKIENISMDQLLDGT
ncbi:MAG: hypothetical protein R3A12_02660 [Ignavibacteria bacterium]